MKVALVYNPTIRTAREWAERARGRFPGAEISTEFLDADRIVVFGGDGTVHAAANARPGAEIAIVPCGSGNDFVKTLGIPQDPEQAIEIAAGPARPLDVVEYEVEVPRPSSLVPGHPPGVSRRGTRDQGPGTATRRGRFINIAEVGFGARVVAHATRMKGVTGKKTSYKIGILTALAGHRLQPVSLEIDGRKVGDYLVANLIVANGQYFGSGMRPVPHARPDDGRLDVVVLNEFGRWKILRQKGVLKTGLPRNHQKIHHFSGCDIRVASPERVLVEADGEVLGNLPAAFRVLPGAMRVVCPP